MFPPSRAERLIVLDERVGTVAPPGVQEGLDKMWPKTAKAFEYVWEHHPDDADWFMKVDDDTWVSVYNLRCYLVTYDANKPHYMDIRIDYNCRKKRDVSVWRDRRVKLLN